MGILVGDEFISTLSNKTLSILSAYLRNLPCNEGKREKCIWIIVDEPLDQASSWKLLWSKQGVRRRMSMGQSWIEG